VKEFFIQRLWYPNEGVAQFFNYSAFKYHILRFWIRFSIIYL